MKRLLSVSLTLLLLSSFILTACGGGAAPTSEPKADQPTTKAQQEAVGGTATGGTATGGTATGGTATGGTATGGAATGGTATGGTATDGAATDMPASDGDTITALVGFTASLTGKYDVESKRQNNGLNLWMQQVNEAGGVALSDGTRVMFAPKFYDDGSDKDRVQELYTRLCTEDKADFLISPYSSGLTEAAAVIAEQNQKIMITTGAASDETYQKGFTLVYQAYTPASRYLTGAVDLLADTDPEVKKIAIVYENSKFSTSVVEAVKTYAEEKGYEIVLYEGYDAGTTDFAPFINKIQQAVPEAILGGGYFQDGSTFTRQLSEKNVPIKFMALLVAPPEPDFAELGDAAFGVIGPSQWEPRATFTPEDAKTLGIEWYGPDGSEFVAAYQTAYEGEEPSYHATGGYVAGLILQRAIEQAGSLETEAVAAALDAMNVLTFYGHIQFDTSEEAHGLQVGHDMVYIQWQRDGEELVKQVVWPKVGATADVVYPIR